MKQLFLQKSEKELSEYIRTQMKEYENKKEEFSNPQVVYEYLFLVMHYLTTQRPASEQNVDSILKLLGATQKERGYRFPFFTIMEHCAKKNPNDPCFADATMIESTITATDIREIDKFVEWMLMREADTAEKDRLLGLMVYSRMLYSRKDGKKIILKHATKSDNEMSNDFRQQCEAFINDYNPKKIKTYLDRYIIGQEEAKQNISTAIYNHYLRILYPDKKLIKNNVLMIGPSGCGKTEIIRRVMELVNVPVVISDFSGVVATPWKGRNKEEALLNLYIRSGNDLAKTERGIVFYDEFDKIIPGRAYKYGGDINNELQGQLLGMMEGTMLEVPLNGGRQKIYMNTDNILFICAGAFDGLEEIVRKDMPESQRSFGMPFGSNSEVELTQEHIKVDHFIKYGMKPELAGRLGMISVLKGLSREELRRVLTEPEDSIMKRYQNEFWSEDEIKLSFTDDALDAIIDRVMDMNIGARALNALLHEVLADAMFEAPTKEGITEVVITEAVVRDASAPEYR